jgi:hypothetical protein
MYIHARLNNVAMYIHARLNNVAMYIHARLNNVHTIQRNDWLGD